MFNIDRTIQLEFRTLELTCMLRQPDRLILELTHMERQTDNIDK